MLDDIKVFWEFFFFPLMNMDGIPLFVHVVSAVLMCYCIVVFVREVLACFS